MPLKTINQNPKITDTIRFVLETPDVNDCLSSNPYKVENIKIYYVERNFLGNNYGSYEKRQLNEYLLSELQSIRQLVCEDPSEENIFELNRAQNELFSKSKSDVFYYKDAVLVEDIGTPYTSVWLSTDVENSLLEQVTEDSEGNPIYGTFIYDWNPKSKVREGDFFICWTWAPLIAGDSLSAHKQFSLWGDGRSVQTLPTHHTPENKYYTLLERYLPEMYKASLTDNDITPRVTDNLNYAIADGFTYLEDYANQIIDLYDANVLHESLLVYLSNLFNLKLKSDDPTLWRRQIKESVPLFKKKGTLGGLKEAFAQSGITLDKYTQLWQVVSKYTWVQSWKIKDSATFKLDKPFVELNANFVIWIRREDSSDYESVDLDNVEFEETDCEYFVTWIGGEKEIPVHLYEGDILKVRYQFAEIPDTFEQENENYIQQLDLADERDEALVDYPPKNWNVRVIEEEDPLFDTIIPVRHPFQDYLVFGKVRTEFPYSENIYNMEEYNGCVVKGTPILTKCGVINVEDLDSQNPLMTEFGYQFFEKLVDQGEKNCIEIETKTGRKITVTNTHKFKVFDGHDIIWKCASDIRLNDSILSCTSKKIVESNLINSWYLLGYMYGDGYQENSKNRRFNWLISKESDFLVSFENIISSSCGYNKFLRIKEKHQKNCRFNCNEDVWLYRSSEKQFKELKNIAPKFQQKGEWKKNIPQTVWDNTDFICSFLAGLFDSDGGVQKGKPVFTTKYLELAEKVQLLLSFIGFKSSVTHYFVEYEGEKRKYYRTRLLGIHKESLDLMKILPIQSIQKKKALENNWDSTYSKNKCKNGLGRSSLVFPDACNLLKDIFPYKKRLFPRGYIKSQEEKNINTLITRIKQGYTKNIPDNAVRGIYNLAKCNNFDTTKSFSILKDYVENNWYFDKVVSKKDVGKKNVYDPLNVNTTSSYISNGFVSHNSTRDSYDVCFIDKDFRDPCGSCISSKYNIYIAIENLTNDRLVEVYDILNEYTPFTSVVHRINFRGDVVDFVYPPVEEIDFLVQFNLVEYVISGGANPFFHRVMEDGLTNWVIDRESVSQETEVVSTTTGDAYNKNISIITPNINLNGLGLIIDNHVLQILSPSPNSGFYTLGGVNGQSGTVATSVIEPLNSEAFTFKLSNIVYETFNAQIIQEECGSLSDDNGVELLEYGIKTIWDIEITPDYNGGAWQIYFPSLSKTVNISKVEGETIYLECNQNISSGTYNYVLLDDDGNIVLNSIGTFEVTLRGRVHIVDPNGIPVSEIVKHGDYLLYDDVEYIVDELKLNGDLTVNNYTEGSAAGVSVKFLRRLVNNDVGYFVYSGLQMITLVNHEVDLGIQNGSGSPVTDSNDILDNSNFKENYLIKINDDFYKMAQINGTVITLEGIPQDWGTIISGGTAVNYSIHQFINDTIETSFIVFDQVDRRGKDVVVREIESTVTNDVAIAALSLKPQGGQGVEESIMQEESVSFEIEYLNGNIQEGEL